MNKNIIWFIDESENQRLTYGNKLRKKIPNSISVNAIPPFPRKDDYIDYVLNNPDTCCLIIDQKLKDTGIADYFGIELAEYLRAINNKIPIYILTNAANDKDDFDEGEWSVEDIISKGDIRDDKKLSVVVARLLRGINVYQDILLNKSKRFSELINKSLDNVLSQEEQSELRNLQVERTSPVLAEELQYLDDIEKNIDKYQSILDKINSSSKKG